MKRKRCRCRAFPFFDHPLEQNLHLCYSIYNKFQKRIATSKLQEGENLPSVRQLADTIGINMHTVNKAYSVLKQEGFVTIDRRRGAVISVDADKIRALEEMKEELRVLLAKGSCRNISRAEVHELIDEIYEEYE